jgi:hypothetical protein
MIGILLLLSSFAFGKWGVEVNYPGVGIKYAMAKNVNVVEVKAQFSKNIRVGGLRYYRYLEGEKTRLFVGAEGDYISFKGEEVKGKGFAISNFVGIERFLDFFSMSVDVGPVYIRIKDDESKISESGIDFLLNISITCYIGGGDDRK